jgi:hypothetical protein
VNHENLFVMATSLKLSDNLIKAAKCHAEIYNRSIPKQVEYWASIGKIAEENPDLSYSFIKDILFALKEQENGEVEEYIVNGLK